MTSLSLLSTDVEESLRSTVRSLLASRCTPDRVTAVYDGDDSVCGPLWQAQAWRFWGFCRLLRTGSAG